MQEDAKETEWTPERISSTTELRVGDRVRLSIESPRDGYLYVVDREQYADGSFGDPYLIFPTLRTNNGDNRVRPGRLVDMPAQSDNPNYFTLIPSPSREDQVAEVLSIIVTTEPLENLRLAEKPLKLSKVSGGEVGEAVGRARGAVRTGGRRGPPLEQGRKGGQRRRGREVFDSGRPLAANRLFGGREK